MSSVTVRKHIDAPPATVFAALSDFEHAAGRVSGIKRVEMLTDGPVRVGTRFRETRIMFKREATEEMEVTALEPGRYYTLEAGSCGYHYTTTIRCEPETMGTAVTMEMTARPVTLMARAMSPLGMLLAGTVRKCLEKDLEDVRAALESERLETQPA